MKTMICTWNLRNSLFLQIAFALIVRFKIKFLFEFLKFQRVSVDVGFQFGGIKMNFGWRSDFIKLKL